MKMLIESSVDFQTLEKIGREVKTQDNRCTCEPMFCVQVCERIGPLIPEYCDGDRMMFHDHECTETFWPESDRWRELKDLYDSGDLPENFSAGGFSEVWKTVQVCLTEAGCKQYLDQDRHNLRHYHGVRIYVESFRRNVEMTIIRQFFQTLEGGAK